MALEILYQNMYDWIYNLFRTLRERMKSKDLQTTVKKINMKTKMDQRKFIGSCVIKNNQTMGSNAQQKRVHRFVSSAWSANESKHLKSKIHKKTISTRRLTAEMNISRISAQRMLRKDLGCFPYKKIKQPKLSDLQKIEDG